MRRRSKTSVQAKVVVVEVLVRRCWVASVGRLVGRMEQRARVKGNVDSAHVGHPLAAWFPIRTRSTLSTLHAVSIIKIPASNAANRARVQRASTTFRVTSECKVPVSSCSRMHATRNTAACTQFTLTTAHRHLVSIFRFAHLLFPLARCCTIGR